MYRELKRHRFAYSLLLIGMTVLGIAIFAAWPNYAVQRMLIGALVVFYFVWGVMTHLHTRTVTKRVVLEYGGAAVLAGALLALMTF